MEVAAIIEELRVAMIGTGLENLVTLPKLLPVPHRYLAEAEAGPPRPGGRSPRLGATATPAARRKWLGDLPPGVDGASPHRCAGKTPGGKSRPRTLKASG